MGEAGTAYDPGHLALREGPLLESAILALPARPDVLLVNATGRDHARRAGLALHLGARLDLPSVGVTNRLLVATGPWPADAPRAQSPFRLQDEIVGYWVRARRGTRPLAVHAGWRTDAATAREIVLACIARARTPEPLRAARRAAREGRQRARAGGSSLRPSDKTSS
jgi:deoxyribonuclease V